MTFFSFGKYSPVPSYNFSGQGYGSVFFTTMEPLPGIFVVEWECTVKPNHCDIDTKNSYDHLNSTSKSETNNEKTLYNVTDSIKEIETFTTKDSVCMTSGN